MLGVRERARCVKQQQQQHEQPHKEPVARSLSMSAFQADYLRITPSSSGSAIARAEDWWRYDGAVRAFGGQTVAHCVLAAIRQAPAGWSCHSIHTHFLRGGLMVDTRYEVTPLRVGRTYSVYRVRAIEIEGDHEIAHAVVSFHDEVKERENGAPRLHTARMPPGASTCGDDGDTRTLQRAGVESWPGCEPADGSGLRWRLSWPSEMAGALNTDARRVAAIAFLSDLRFIWAAHVPHQDKYAIAMITSLDHTLHFHGAALATGDTSVLYQMESPFAGEGRGLVRGWMWDEVSGALLATTVQEGVLRVLPAVEPAEPDRTNMIDDTEKGERSTVRSKL